MVPWVFDLLNRTSSVAVSGAAFLALAYFHNEFMLVLVSGKQKAAARVACQAERRHSIVASPSRLPQPHNQAPSQTPRWARSSNAC